jgi:glycosyltransferase involved in cell wall biosynthesis
MVRVSVVLTVYNGEKYIADALESLRAQTYPDFETVVVDDGSTDRTAGIVRPYTNDRVRLLSPGRLGYPRVLNHGIAAAQGEYIAILDADDIALPTLLEREVDLLDAHPEIGLVGAGHRQLRQDGSGQDYPCAEEDAELRRTLLFGIPFGHSGAMYRRACFDRVGGYDESLACCGDPDLFLRMAAHCRLGGVRDILWIRRLTGDNYFTTRFRGWNLVRTSLGIRFRHLRGICPAPAWWFYWIAPVLLPRPVRRWLRRSFWRDERPRW